jgi:hypothetical protein
METISNKNQFLYNTSLITISSVTMNMTKEQSDNYADDAMKNLEEIKQIGININEKLILQNEKLDKITDDVEITSSIMEKSNIKINDINTKENKNKLALSGGLALCLIPVIGIKISCVVFVSTFVISKF